MRVGDTHTRGRPPTIPHSPGAASKETNVTWYKVRGAALECSRKLEQILNGVSNFCNKNLLALA